jgi:DNA-binding MurR/RpiR family transcriptional regulator
MYDTTKLKLLSTIFDIETINEAEQNLLLAMAFLADGFVVAGLSTPFLASRAKTSRSTVFRLLKSLKEKNLICVRKVYDADYAELANDYFLHFSLKRCAHCGFFQEQLNHKIKGIRVTT